MTARRPDEAATISERERVAGILRDLDPVRAEALEAVRAVEALWRGRRGRVEGERASGAAQGRVAGGMNGIEWLAVVILPLVIVALGLPMALLWCRTILLRGRRRRMGLLARLMAAWRGE